MGNNSFLGLCQKSTHTSLTSIIIATRSNLFSEKHMVQAGWRAWMKLRWEKPLDSFGKSTTSLGGGGGSFCCETFCEFGSFQENGVFDFGKVWEWWDTWKEKWKWPETTETTPKEARTGWWNRRATVLVRHGTLWPGSSTSASLMCTMCWRKLMRSTASARRSLVLLQLKSRGSEPGRGKWAWDAVRVAPESNPPLPPKLTQLRTFGLSWRQKFTEVAGKPKRRINWSAGSLDACGTWTGSLSEAAWTAGRRTFEKRPTNLHRFFSNSARSILINPLFRKIKTILLTCKKVGNLMKAVCAEFYWTPGIIREKIWWGI